MKDDERLPRIGRKGLVIYSLIFVVAPVVSFFSGHWLDQALHAPRGPPFPANVFIGIVIFFSGLKLGVESTRLLYRVGLGLPWGEVNNDVQSARLVTTGPFAHVRNPMTLGYSLLPCGMGVMFQSPSITFLFPLIVLAPSTLILWLREEPCLAKRFGSSYIEYKKRTPFLLPSPRTLLMWPLGGSTAASSSAGRLPQGAFPLLLISIAVVALYSLSLLVLESPFSYLGGTLQMELLILSFVAICALGAAAGIYPSLLQSLTRGHRSAVEASDGGRNCNSASFSRGGHHRLCGGFRSHVLRFGGTIYCSGCSGLVIGALGAIFTIASYASFQYGSGEHLFKFGLTCVFCGLLQYEILDFGSAIFHAALNSIYVFGTSFMLIGILQIQHNLPVELYFLGLTIYLILVRILLSNAEHNRICDECLSESARTSGRKDWSAPASTHAVQGA